MSEQTVLVIDDSSTIRRLVDSTLSRDGYSVVLAATAEEGIEFAQQIQPDMILLDHQLPGTTGYEVCQDLIASSELSRIPVVISSTLRKRAYVEYADLPNVVDMLPKPYSEDLLMTTVANALSTGSLVVESQAQGTAVPEVIDELGDSDLSGVFQGFSIREVLDFLNNGRKCGALEVEAGHNRYSIHLDRGRVQGVTATGIPANEIIDRLPDSLVELAPVLKITAGRGGSELDSIVDLLDTNVLDPRLLRKLLRHQASVLLIRCFTQELKSFRFDSKRQAPPLYLRLSLDVSVLALLVEGAMTCDEEQMPAISDGAVFSRQPIRGQNLDRAGLSAQQSQILGKFTSPRSFGELLDELGWEADNVRRALFGLELAELIAHSDDARKEAIVFEHDLDTANRLSAAFASSDSYKVHVVHDPTAFRVLARRSSPDALVIDVSLPQGAALLRTMRQAVRGGDVRWIVTNHGDFTESVELKESDARLVRPYSAEDLMDALDGAPTVRPSSKALSDVEKSKHDRAGEPTLCTN